MATNKFEKYHGGIYSEYQESPSVCEITVSCSTWVLNVFIYKSKLEFLYSAVSSPQNCSKHFTLPRQTCSINPHFNLSGKHPATLQLMSKVLL